jgi:uncharacterized protein (TIGR00369 family)
VAAAPRFDHYDEAAAKRLVGRRSTESIAGFLGVETVDVGPGRLTARFEVREALLTRIGNMHGGCLAALVDHCLGSVMYPVMPEGYWAATTEFKLNYLHPVTSGACQATAQVVSMTRRLAVVQVEVDNGGRPVCVAQGTCTIVAPRRPEPS